MLTFLLPITGCHNGPIRTNDLVRSAYLGDQRALGELSRINPDAANQIQQQKVQQQQRQLQEAARLKQEQRSDQEWAMQNRQVIQGVMQKAAQMPDFQSAQQLIASEIQSLQETGMKIPPSMSAQSFTPEVFAQLQKAFPKTGEAFTLTPGAQRFDAAGKLIADNPDAKERERAQDANGVLRYVDDGTPVFPQVEKLEAELTDKDRFDRAKAIRGEIESANKDFTQIANSWDRIAAGQGEATPASDMALVFNFMKMLDPGSTVREGEYANAQNTTGIPGQLLNAYNKAREGLILNPDQRANFLAQAQQIFNAAQKRADDITNEYVRVAERGGLSRDDVFIDRGAAPTVNGAPRAGQIVDGYKFKGGDPANPDSWEQQ
jgi:hypothetical protein